MRIEQFGNTEHMKKKKREETEKERRECDTYAIWDVWETQKGPIERRNNNSDGDVEQRINGELSHCRTKNERGQSALCRQLGIGSAK
jgi:hypothetical protein